MRLKIVCASVLAGAALLAAGCGTPVESAARAPVTKAAGERAQSSHRAHAARFVLRGYSGHLRVFAFSHADTCPPKPVPVSGRQATGAGEAVLAVLPKLFSPRAYPPVNVAGAYVLHDILAAERKFPYLVARSECGEAVLGATVFVFTRLPHEESMSASAAHGIFYVARVRAGWAIWGAYF